MQIVIFLLVAAVLALYFISLFNRLVTLKNRYLNAFAQIEVQLKRRYDLIPGLVETAKGYLKHERETLEAVVAARNAASERLSQAHAKPGEASVMDALSQAEQSLAGAMGRFNLLVEEYPDLKANENMIRLHEELTATENKVAFSRQAYNDSVMRYNTYRQSFPQHVVAATFGHPEDAVLLEFEDSEAIQAAPTFSF
jgi:LemA protein